MDCVSFSSSNLPFHFIRPNHMEVSQVMGMPPRIFHERNHPAIEWGSPIYGTPHNYFVSQSLCCCRHLSPGLVHLDQRCGSVRFV